MLTDKMEKKINNLIEDMTLEEKASLCSGAGPWSTKNIEKLDLPAIKVSDGPHGLRVVKDPEDLGADSEPATCFPTASALASSWDRDLVGKIGEALGEECKNLGVHILLGPGVNMKRTPLCGRNFEYYSEDPYLAGEMGLSFVNGVQSQGVGTSLKHFACNNQEYQRFTINAEVGERALREIYLPAFEKVVTEAQPWTVMCCYNRVNGSFGSENDYLLTSILRKEWGFQGFVVSDWGAVNDRVKGVKAGLDLEMPGPSPLNDGRIVEAVKAGELEESVLDKVVSRNLSILFKAREQELPQGEIDVKGHHSLARKTAAESMVLLKNEAEILPLDMSKLNSIAVIGQMAQEPKFEGGGSSHVNPTLTDIPLDEINNKAGDTVDINYITGYPDDDAINVDMIAEAVTAAEKADVALIFAGLPNRIESEGYDRKHIDLPENQIQLIEKIVEKQPQTVVVLNNGSAVSMNPWLEKVPAVLEGWLSGQGSGGAIADIITGEVNPSGKLAETFPVSLEDNPSYINYPGENGQVNYGEGLFIGYRYYDKKDIEPQFPFGYGLSYTEFTYDGLALSSKKIKDTEELEVSLKVTNTGEVSGKEIVQLYVTQHQSRLVRPEKELKGFAKVELAPGKAEDVTMKLDRRSFAYYDPSRQDWIVESGKFDVLIGSSSRDIRLKETVEVEAVSEPGKILTIDNPVNDWLEDEKGKAVMEQILSDEQMAFLNDEKNRFACIFPLQRLSFLSKGLISEEDVEEIIEQYDH